MYRPKSTVGPVTLQRRLGTGGIGDTWLGTLDDEGGRPVVARILHPNLRQDVARLAALATRVHDLQQVKHPLLLEILGFVEAGEERLILETWVDGVGFHPACFRIQAIFDFDAFAPCLREYQYRSVGDDRPDVVDGRVDGAIGDEAS